MAQLWPFLAASTASVASTASQAASAASATPGRTGFHLPDPAGWLGWTVPLLLVVPLLGFVLIASGARSRRATSNLALLTVLAQLVDVLLVWIPRFRHTDVYDRNPPFQWINIPVSFTGATQFQGFGIDITMHADHVALAAITVLDILLLGVVAWHRAGGRQEGAPARVNSLFLVALLGATGAVLSTDLAALAGWWGILGAATYLLLAQRGGTDALAAASRLAFALPFLGDLLLLAGIAILYSRFGQLNVTHLDFQVLRGTYDAGLRSVDLAAVLIGFGCLVRAGAFPFGAWTAAAREALPAAQGLAQGAWPLVATVVLYRALPLFYWGGPQPWRILAYACAATAILGPLLGLAGNDLRRSLAWAGSGLGPLAMLAIGQPGAAAASVAAIFAVALGRPAAWFAATALASAMKTADLALMGEALRRMRWTALALLAGCVAPALAFAGKGAYRAGWGGDWFLAVALAVSGLALGRLWAAPALGALRRRRAFEPTRVRETVRPLWWPGLLLGGGAAAAAVLAAVPAWPDFLAGSAARPALATQLLWVLVALAGPAAGIGLVLAARPAFLGFTGRAGDQVAAWAGTGVLGWSAFAAAVTRVLEVAEGRVVERAEGRLGERLDSAAAGLVAGAAMLPAAALAILLLAALAVIAGLLAPGVYR